MRFPIYLSAAMLLGGATVAMALQLSRFSSGHASAPLPDSFKVTARGEDLVATFGEDGDHMLELTLLKDLSGPGVPAGKAVAFVEMEGEKRGVDVKRDGNRAVLMEAGEQSRRKGKTFQAVHWQIAVDNCLFTMTVTAPLPMSKELDEFLGEPLNALMQGISCTP